MSDIKEKTLKLIDGLKATCQSYGMGNDGNEYKIITQVFLYKFLNDKFGYELKNAKSEIAKKLTGDVKWEETTRSFLTKDEIRLLMEGKLKNAKQELYHNNKPDANMCNFMVIFCDIYNK